MENIIESLIYHLEWRQTFYPYGRLTDPLLKLLKTGIFYFHGRCKDYSPILILNFGLISNLLKKGEVDPHRFCALHNFIAMYMV